MGRGSKIVLLLFGLAFLGILITEIVRPRPLNWRPSFTRSATIPFGCYVLYNELPRLFPGQEPEALEGSPYEWLRMRDSTQPATLLFINDQTYFDEQETDALLEFAASGNTVFLASQNFGPYLSDTLNLGVRDSYSLLDESVRLSLSSRDWHSESYSYDKGYIRTYFSSVDTATARTLGRVEFREQQLPADTSRLRSEINFIRQPFGKGELYLHTTPYAFTNYYLIGGNEAYAAHVLSYLGDDPLYWDNYVKSGRVVVESPMRFVLAQPALRWAYYLAAAGLLLFVVFKARRVQRIIPIITPLENSSVNFAQTVGELYFQHRDYSGLIDKRLQIFREHLRSRYFLKWDTADPDLARKLSLKTGVTENHAAKAVAFIRQLQAKSTNNEQDLMRLHRLLEPFKI